VPKIHPHLSTAQRKQRSIKNSVSFSGIGVHTGKEVSMRFRPAPENSGILFKRVDLPDQPIIPANVNSVCDTLRSTSIGSGTTRINTVEHVLAAVKAFDIDNLLIEISNVEPPIGNGSSDVFVKMIEDAGIVEQKAITHIAKINEPIYSSEKDMHIVALPCDNEFRISYVLNYPDSKILNAQFYSVSVNAKSFCSEIASCRTFSRYEEVSALMDRGLIKGGSLDNAVIIKDNVVFSKEGLRFPDEPVRHKILDMIGDLSLVGCPFYAHVIAIRSGHSVNFQLSKKISQYIYSEE